MSSFVANEEEIRNFLCRPNMKKQDGIMFANAITAPSACNLQAWHFIVVDTPEGKDKLRSFFMKFNLPQLETSSAIVMLFGDTLAFKNYRAVWENI